MTSYFIIPKNRIPLAAKSSTKEKKASFHFFFLKNRHFMEIKNSEDKMHVLKNARLWLILSFVSVKYRLACQSS